MIFNSPATAAEFFVNSTDDVVDADSDGPFDGICETVLGNGICTLRAAIQEANANGTTDTIHIPAGTFPVNGAAGEDNSVTGDLDITSNLTLLGAGAQDTILQSDGNDRVIHVKGSIEVEINGLTVKGGKVTDENGGGINTEIAKSIVINSKVTENEVISNLIGSEGGGIANNGGELIIDGCTVSHNSSAANNGEGGGVYTEFGPLTVNNSTISYNIADGRGGGVLQDSGTHPVIISNCTIVYNSVIGVGTGGGGVRNITALKNSIIANNTGPDSPDCGGNTFQLQGGNLIENGEGCNFTNQSGTDQIGTPDNPIDPKIDSNLKNNGGPTDTHSLLTGSLAIDAGDPNNCPATDQRGVTRPQGDQCDIGAFELAPTDDANGNGIPDNQETNTGNDGTNDASGGCAIAQSSTGQGFYLFAMILILVGAGMCACKWGKKW